jgi:cytochrome c553
MTFKNTLCGTALLCLVSLSGTLHAAAVDAGRTLFASNCASCHSASGTLSGASAAAIRGAIQGNRGGMARLATLSDAELQDIAAYLAPAATTVATTSTTTSSGADATTSTATTTGGSTTGSASTDADGDRIFDWAESAYPKFFTGHATSQLLAGYYLRHYQSTGLYLAMRDGQLYFFDSGRPGEGLLRLGSVADWLAQIGTGSAAKTGQDTRESGDREHDDNERDERDEVDEHGSRHERD